MAATTSNRNDVQPGAERMYQVIDALHGLCHAFGSAESVEECVDSALRWARTALGDDATAIRLFLPSSRGRGLTLAGGDPDPYSSQSIQHRNRLRCFHDKVQMRTSVEDQDIVFDLALVSRGHSLGVFEVECSTETFQSGEQVLEAVVSQAAIVLRNLRFRRELGDRIEALQSSVEQLADSETSRSKQLELGLAWAAHEFRGRLTSVQMVLDHLVTTTDEEDDSVRLELMKRSQDQVQYVGALTELLVTGMVSRDSIQKVDTDLVELVRTTIDECEWELEQDRVVYEGPERVLLPAGPKHLRSAIGNVIRNALVYSPEDTTVHVELRTIDKTVILAVHDQGPGISSDARETIFQPFVRGEGEPSRTEGIGIGLFVAKHVVEAHDGTIRVVTGRGGRGTSFVIELPHYSGSGS